MKKAIQRELFGRLMSGGEATLYTLRAENGLCVSIIDYRGTITSIWAPDREGALEDVVLADC
jgi:aldose 1-epimerase